MSKYLNILFNLSIAALLIFIITLCLYKIFKDSKNKNNDKNKNENKDILYSILNNEKINNLGKLLYNQNLEEIFRKSKNPWDISIELFQIIRYGGFLVFFIIGIILLALKKSSWIYLMLIAFLFVYYPLYYYKGIAKEREDEWYKMYEFIWVIKHNLMLYDPAKAYLNTKLYIEEHAPHNKELIQGFDDFYKYWNINGIDPYIDYNYPFPITREITQIIFNTAKTGNFPEESLNSLRYFIINQQDLSVEKCLSKVSTQATLSSLPFLMISVIIALMIPLIMQLKFLF